MIKLQYIKLSQNSQNILKINLLVRWALILIVKDESFFIWYSVPGAVCKICVTGETGSYIR